MFSRRVDSRRNCRWVLARLALFVSFFMFAPMSLTIAAPAHQEFRWAADPEGGVPFVEADPARPDMLVGFDVEIAEIVAQGLNRSATFLNVAFTSIDQSIDRGDAEIGLGGIEDTSSRRATMAPTVPYYRFREVLSVRDTDASRFRTLADLRGRRIGTLGGTIAYEILLRAERATSASKPFPMMMICIPIPIWLSDVWMPCCSITFSPSVAVEPSRDSLSSRKALRLATTSGSLQPGTLHCGNRSTKFYAVQCVTVL
jgi:hypothetical protein